MAPRHRLSLLLPTKFGRCPGGAFLPFLRRPNEPMCNIRIASVNAATLQSLFFCVALVAAATKSHGSDLSNHQCGVSAATGDMGIFDEPYFNVLEPTLSPKHWQDLPGFTRSVYKRNHALIMPESQVFGALNGWTRTIAAYLVSPAMGSHFVMYLVKMEANSSSGLPAVGTERFVFVIKGALVLSTSESSQELLVDSFAYLPPDFKHALTSDLSSTAIIYERRYQKVSNGSPKVIVGSTRMQPVLETPGEVFVLRKLLPTSEEYDFNIHVMDFEPGEYLNVKEVHYNQHGLLMLEGRGIYRLGDDWYPVQAGDAIWMAPFVPQWYAALGRTRTRYLLYKDANRDPLLHVN